MGADRLIAIVGAVIVHLVLAAILAFTLWEDPEPPKSAAHKPIIQARAVDEATAMEPVRRREAEAQRKRDEAERQRKAAEAERQRKAEEKRKAAEAERQRQATLKRKQAEEERRKAEEQRKKAEAEKQQLAEEQRKKAEAEKQRLAEERRKKEEAEAKLKAAMAAEEKRLAAEEQRARYQQQLASERERYYAAIQNAVQRLWQRPPGSAREFVCKVFVKQIPSGDVIDVRVIESCGSIRLDRSVEQAVRNASPLPLPAARELFDSELVITFVPE